jgi:cytochrome b
MAQEKRLVWDLPLRLFHWLLVLSLIASWVTAELGLDNWTVDVALGPLSFGWDVSWRQVHFALGYWMIGLLFFRILWGIVGPRHARFTSFLPSPARLFRYIRASLAGNAVETVGHNPLGSLMVILMIVLIGFQVGTGLFATDDIIWAGPYNPAVSSVTARFLTRLHHFNFNLILAAIALHIGAITFHWAVKKHNLVLPMVTGWKPADVVPPGQEISSSHLWKAAIVIAVSAAAAYWLIAAAPPPPDSLYY